MNETHFLNVDLDIESNENLDELVKELGKNLSIMTHHSNDGINFASFETSGSGIEEIIDMFIVSIEGLNGNSKAIWNSCIKREFNFGFQCGIKPNGYTAEIDPELLTKIINVGGQVGITIYPPENSST